MVLCVSEWQRTLEKKTFIENYVPVKKNYVPVSFVIDGNDVHENDVLLVKVDSRERHPQGREHSSVKGDKTYGYFKDSSVKGKEKGGGEHIWFQKRFGMASAFKIERQRHSEGVVVERASH